MHNTAIIRLVDGRLVWYAGGVGELPQYLDDEAVVEQLRQTLSDQRTAVIFAAPGADVRLLRLTLSSEEKKHIGKSLPFMLEERVADDIDQLHFASVVLDKLELGVAICHAGTMEHWRELLADMPGVRSWLPEPLLLPWQQGEWCIVLEGNEALVRFDACGGFSSERELLPAMLTGAIADYGKPDTVVVYGENQNDDLALLPDVLHGAAQWRRGNINSALLLTEAPFPALNLLQGQFANRLPLTRWWQQWRAVAAVLAVAFILQLVATYSDYRQLSKENVELRAAIEASYRQANPRGNAPNPELQLQRQLSALRGSGDASGFVHLVEQVGAVIASNGGTSIDTINYNFSSRGGEMRMNISAADFDAVEKVRAAINETGLEAIMESSSAQGERVRARLRVGDRS
ncbi:MAG: type II secretion system protein GspL [Pseudomonadota bacterium]